MYKQNYTFSNNSFDFKNLNLTSDDDDDISPSTLVYVISVSFILSLIDIVTLIGNLLVVVSVLTTKCLSTVTNYFIMSLAVADMLIAVFVLPISIYITTHPGRWIFGRTICKLWSFSDVMLCTASILNLCCISLDRYFAITRPLQYSRQRSPKQARGMIAVVWIASIIISSPPLIPSLFSEDINNESQGCAISKLLSYRIYSSTGSFFLPAFVMLFVYARIFKVIHDREKYLMTSNEVSRKRNLPPKKPQFLRATSEKNNNSNQYTASAQATNRYNEQLRLLKESKAAKTLSIVVGGFIVCWSVLILLYNIIIRKKAPSILLNIINNIRTSCYLSR
jgi:hypothetical protein